MRMKEKILIFCILSILGIFFMQIKEPQISFSEQRVVCHTPNTGSNTLQMGSCYVITVTSTPLTAAPTLNPTPTSTQPQPPVPPPTGQHTLCSGTIVSFGIQKTLIPIRPWHGRPGWCMTPKSIVLHITATGGTPAQIRDYFASGSNGRGSSAQFIIGQNGSALQILETLGTTAEVGFGVGGYLNDISIEMISPAVYRNKAAQPVAQYNTTITLVRKLMAQYHIPLGNLQWNWQDFNNPLGDPNLAMGVYGHYQLNPFARTDPGSGWFCDFRNDLGAHAACNYNVVL